MDDTFKICFRLVEGIMNFLKVFKRFVKMRFEHISPFQGIRQVCSFFYRRQKIVVYLKMFLFWDQLITSYFV